MIVSEIFPQFIISRIKCDKETEIQDKIRQIAIEKSKLPPLPPKTTSSQFPNKADSKLQLPTKLGDKTNALPIIPNSVVLAGGKQTVCVKDEKEKQIVCAKTTVDQTNDEKKTLPNSSDEKLNDAKPMEIKTTAMEIDEVRFFDFALLMTFLLMIFETFVRSFIFDHRICSFLKVKQNVKLRIKSRQSSKMSSRKTMTFNQI